MNKEEFKKQLADRGLVLTEEQLGQLDTYAAFLKEYNEKINLTAITEYEEVLEKHFYDSLILSFYKEMKGTLVDVGTGAGFPGVVLKICYPDLQVILLEPLKKRCVFLNELLKLLNLSGIEVINARGEDYALEHREAYDFVTARAVANLNVLSEVCGAMVKKNGYFIALRGLNGESELKEAAKAIKQLGFVLEDSFKEQLSDGSLRVLAFFKKAQVTPQRFPRKYSIIKQKPL